MLGRQPATKRVEFEKQHERKIAMQSEKQPQKQSGDVCASEVKKSEQKKRIVKMRNFGLVIAMLAN